MPSPPPTTEQDAYKPLFVIELFFDTEVIVIATREVEVQPPTS